ncbi:hypothetical protein [Aggregatibacter actinomycetemcomitans]|uniref:hypothetical protein n=1 Tax=Aggregatibacter actinomycetemcomitans TaxID=714 RepID=UPI0011DB06CE|nr:hypothetical protein [Aggregatibacter actinomycetemcomitans]TYB21586.1 hypothetical protein FXB85_04895 [Aggregatibacter actinomycetemcomitans]
MKSDKFLLLKSFDGIQFRIFIFINILAVIGFGFIVLSLALSGNFKSFINYFMEFLLFYTPAVWLIILINFFVGKRFLATCFAFELVIFLIILFLTIPPTQ